MRQREGGKNRSVRSALQSPCCLGVLGAASSLASTATRSTPVMTVLAMVVRSTPTAAGRAPRVPIAARTALAMGPKRTSTAAGRARPAGLKRDASSGRTARALYVLGGHFEVAVNFGGGPLMSAGEGEVGHARAVREAIGRLLPAPSDEPGIGTVQSEKNVLQIAVE